MAHNSQLVGTDDRGNIFRFKIVKQGAQNVFFRPENSFHQVWSELACKHDEELSTPHDDLDSNMVYILNY